MISFLSFAEIILLEYYCINIIRLHIVSSKRKFYPICILIALKSFLSFREENLAKN